MSRQPCVRASSAFPPRKMCGLKRGELQEFYRQDFIPSGELRWSMYIFELFSREINLGKKVHCEVVLVVWDLIIGRSMSFIFLSFGVSCSSCAMGFSSKLDLNLTVEQRYTYRVLQTIQMKLILLCVWAEPAVLGSTKTALKFKFKI